MPIPQLSRKTKLGQYWKGNSKKYSLRGGSDWRRPSGPKRPDNGKNKLSDLFSRIPRQKLINFGLAFFAVSLLFAFITVAWLSRGLPDPNHLMDREIAQSTKIYDRSGEHILYDIHGDEKRTLVSLNEIPDYLKWATISIEDKDYYNHGGFSVWAIFRTVVTDIAFGKKAGGSTLTQQFVKNSILTNEKTFTRKIKELILAYQLEKRFSKDEILQMYLNEIPYGSTAYGVEAASQRYFGKSVKNVNMAEAAVLAAIPQAPTRYSPYGSHKDLLLARQQYILDQMVKYGYIDKDQAAVAKAFQVKFKEPNENITAPHFVMYIKEQLEEKYGEKMIEQGGLKIYTTLDVVKQKAAEEAVKEISERNEKKYQATNAALVSIDPKNGQILAMVGSKDYFNDDIDGQVNVVTSSRQPGSSIKPIVYAAAFAKGYTPNTILYDVNTNFSTDANNPYEPHNYDLAEHGAVTMRKALAGSLNIPAVKTVYLAGVKTVLDLAKKMGYTTLTDHSRFGLSLVLGGGEVKLLEHANAFSAFAREGEIHPVNGILKIEDNNGKILEETKEEKGEKVLDSNVAKMINDILSDNASRAYIFGEKNFLTLNNRQVAAKTGTTNDYHDAWTIGYTPSIVTGVWVGNNNNAPMKRGADGSVVAAPIWHQYMQTILGNTPAEAFNKPSIPATGKPVLDGTIVEGGMTVKIDKASGLLATEFTPASFIEERIYKQPHSILYYVDKDDPTGDAPKNPADDSQFNLWESRVADWAAKQGFTSTSTPPTEYDNVHKAENQPTFSISMENNQNIRQSISVNINASAPRGINRAEYLIDGNLVSTNTSFPFNLEKDLGFLSSGFHSLTARVCDDVDNCSEKKLDFNLILSQEQTAKDISLDWDTPNGNITLSGSTFPLPLEIITSNPEQTANASFYYLKDKEKTPILISSVSSIAGNKISTAWVKMPPPGIYTLYAEAKGWMGQKVSSKEISVLIQ